MRLHRRIFWALLSIILEGCRTATTFGKAQIFFSSFDSTPNTLVAGARHDLTRAVRASKQILAVVGSQDIATVILEFDASSIPTDTSYSHRLDPR
jgi:hypothetical protein